MERPRGSDILEISALFVQVVGRAESGVVFFDRKTAGKVQSYLELGPSGEVLLTKQGKDQIRPGRTGFSCLVGYNGEGVTIRPFDRKTKLQAIPRVLLMTEGGDIREIRGDAVYDRENPCFLVISKTKETEGGVLIFSTGDLINPHKLNLIKARLR